MSTQSTSQAKISKSTPASQASAAASEHSSLYRKYRPQDFNEVVGQQHIVTILEQEAKKERPCHAFLFAGSRGTGKTTLARIFARNIGTTPEDIYEIDAASNTSVEDIRLLNEAVHTLPLMSKFKVYILDEVHMLSKSAFNAFLKTLEEPPKHVIFILATTELHRIPDTIISRCQVFHLAKPSIATLKDVIKNVGAKEGIEIEDKAAEMIALSGNGSFRDTLSTLHSAFNAVSDKKLQIDHLEKVMSMPPHALVMEFVNSTIGPTAAAPAALGLLQKVYASDMDVKVFADMVMAELRNTMLGAMMNGDQNGGAVLPSDVREKTMRMLDLMLTYRPEIGKTYISVLPLELAVMKFFTK